MNCNDIKCYDNTKDNYTGKYIITFQEESVIEAMKILNNSFGFNNVPTTSDFNKCSWNMEQVESSKCAYFENLGIAVVEAENHQFVNLQEETNSKIKSIEPELIMHTNKELNTLDDKDLMLSYIKGCSDELNSLYDRIASNQFINIEYINELSNIYNDTLQYTWGLQATKTLDSKYTGRGIKVAILDTGLDLNHPDFKNREIISKSFINNEDVQDKNGHGTHCAGTACGNRSDNGIRYGIANESELYIGKVLNNSGSGPDSSILAGIDWAINNNCDIISMSLGAVTCFPSTAYETVGERALQKGTLIIAAAGNSANRSQNYLSCVNRPANCKSIMAVASLDSGLKIANSSARSGNIIGGEIDIAAPGVNIFSSWIMNERYKVRSGTSMATPHVSGIAALFAEAYNVRGFQLWQLLTTSSKKLQIPSIDIGSGIVQAP